MEDSNGLCEHVVKSQSRYVLIQIGLAVRALRNLSASNSVEYVVQSIDILERNLELSLFKVSLVGIHKLLRYKEELAKEDSDKKIGAKLAAEMAHEMRLVERTIFSEAGTKQVYTFPERRLNSEYLLDNPRKLFKSGCYERLSDLAQSDIAGACRCILFGEATAAAFHILRATEEVLKHYYFHHKKTNRLKNPMWGPMTNQLRDKKSKKPPAVVLESLDLVRKSYRNPTQHPDATYDIEGAQDLMGVCIDLINRMANELPNK